MGAAVFGGLRVAIAGLVLLPVLLKPVHWQVFRQQWFKLSLIGILSTGLPFMLWAFALHQINAGTASVINASVPMITGIIAHVFFKDYLTKQQLIGLLLGLLGVVIIMYDGMSSGAQTTLLAFAMAIGACLCYAIGSNLAKHYLSNIAPLTIASSGLFASGILSLPIVLLFYPEQTVSWQAWGSAITIAIFSTAIAMILYYRLIQQIGPTKATVVTLLVPIFAIVLGVVLLDETLTSMMLIGAVVVLCGTSLTLFTKQRKVKASKTLP